MTLPWRCWIVDTRTGVKQLEVFPSSGTWSRVLNGAGRGTHTFKLPGNRLPEDHPDYNPMVDHSLTRLWSRTLVVCRETGGAAFGVLPPVVFSGIITRRRYHQPSKTLTLTEVDIRTLLGRRWPFGPASYWANEGLHIPGRLVCEGLSYRAIIARILEMSLSGTSDIYSLPFVLPPLGEAGPFKRIYENYDFVTAADAIDDIQDSDFGPDVDFEGRWNWMGNHEWNVRTGTPDAPQLSGETFDFDMSVEQPRLTNLSETEDGNNMMTGQASIGLGSEQAMRVGGWGLEGSAQIPALDVTELYKTEIDEPTLASYSVAAIKALGQPTVQYEFGMLASQEPGVVPLASIFRITNNDDPWIPDGHKDLRLISIAGDMTEKLTVDVQPWG
jgi:hypothetical protein